MQTERFPTKRSKMFAHYSPFTWNGLNIRPLSYYLQEDKVLASVEKSFNRYQVVFGLPTKKFVVEDDDIKSQFVCLSITSYNQYEHEGYTLTPPFLRLLNQFYSREIAMKPAACRVEKEGVGILINGRSSSITLYPVSHQ